MGCLQYIQYTKMELLLIYDIPFTVVLIWSKPETVTVGLLEN